MPRTCNSRQNLMKLESSRQIFENFLSIKFQKKCARGGGGCELFRGDKQRDKNDETNSRFSQFYEST